jgi:hypothetical protein
MKEDGKADGKMTLRHWVCHYYLQGVREWSPKNFRVNLCGKMWSKTLIPFFPNMNSFFKNKNLKWCPTVWEL